MNFVKKQPPMDEDMLTQYFQNVANNVPKPQPKLPIVVQLERDNSALKEALKELGGELSRVLEEKNHLYDRLVVTNDALGRLLGKMAKSARRIYVS